MTISEKVAYLKGLAEGLNLDTEKSKEGKLISVMIGILEEIGLSIEDLEENNQALGEEIDALSDDLADVESVVFEDEEDEDDEDEDYDDDWFEVECPTCEEPLIIDDKALAEGVVQCPNCQSKFSLDLSDDTVEADDEE
ncbi:MAG: CD1247 N-terminal domain-containing protein [Lawsonibacter sp.]